MTKDSQTPDLARIEGLIRQVDTLADPAARSTTLELLQAIMDFHGAGIDRMMESIASTGEPGSGIFEEFTKDPLVSSLLLLYGLHPLPLETRIVRALDKVRPYLESHGGNVELVNVTDGIVRLKLQGSCKSCPSSAMTLKLAIEDAIYEAAPDITRVEAEETANISGFVKIERSNGNGTSQHSPDGKGWEDVCDIQVLDHRSVTTMNVRGRSILFCRLEESIFAYDDNCPGCNQPLRGAYLDLNSIVCSHCRQRFDVIRAGRGLDQPALHLQPFPLLVEAGRAKIALP